MLDLYRKDEDVDLERNHGDITESVCPFVLPRIIHQLLQWCLAWHSLPDTAVASCVGVTMQ